MFAALAKQQINIKMIATSEIRVSCVVAEDQGIDALRAVHQAFDLGGKESIEVPTRTVPAWL
jgi:aspartate kinase